MAAAPLLLMVALALSAAVGTGALPRAGATASSTTSSTSVATVARPGDAGTSLGVIMHTHGTPEQLQPVVAAGISIIRTDMSWATLEPSRGRYSFNSTDPCEPSLCPCTCCAPRPPCLVQVALPSAAPALLPCPLYPLPRAVPAPFPAPGLDWSEALKGQTLFRQPCHVGQTFRR
eukprot:SAG22_NODE_1230_length_5074_cov_3.372864_6_plen_175_part_00